MSCDCPSPYDMEACRPMDERLMQEQALGRIASDITEAEHYVLSVIARFFTQRQIVTIAQVGYFPENFFEYAKDYKGGPKGIKFKYEVSYLFRDRKVYYLMHPEKL